MTFAVMKTGGKQYRVTEGDVLRVEKLAADAGETVQFNDILMVGSTIGTPLVEGAAVQAEVIDQIKGDKVVHFVKRRRKHGSQRKKGHRQQLTLLRVTEILEKGGMSTGMKVAIGAGAVAAAAVAGAAVAKVASKASDKKAAKPAAKKDAAPAPKAASEKTVVADAGGDKPDNLLKEARGGQPDDLKKISGVGPALEKKLHANGVFHFDQIAAWNKADIAYMDDQLSFKGRIERDDWIAQAKQFMKEG